MTTSKKTKAPKKSLKKILKEKQEPKNKSERKLERRFSKSRKEDLPMQTEGASYHHFIKAGVSIACIPLNEKEVAVGLALKHRNDPTFNRPLSRKIAEGRARLQRRGSFRAIVGLDFLKENISTARKYEEHGQNALARKVIAGIIGLSGEKV
jgi:hypothetical protein